MDPAFGLYDEYRLTTLHVTGCCAHITRLIKVINYSQTFVFSKFDFVLTDYIIFFIICYELL